MDRPSPGIDFAIIGHQDNWDGISSFVNGIRKPNLEPLTGTKIREIFSFIPPRSVFNIKVRSKTGKEVQGVYIETFIDPDKLTPAHIRSNLAKVKAAARCASSLGARIVALGGFSSIVLEGDLDFFSAYPGTQFTTGNTLTASFIVRGIELAAHKKEIDIGQASVLIIGATGDIGQACVHYFKRRCRKLLLNARNASRLNQLANSLHAEGIDFAHSTVLTDLIGDSDIVVGVASSSEMKVEFVRRNLIVCDAGYPKNIRINSSMNGHTTLFHGGMGCVGQGYSLSPDYTEYFYRFPAPFVSHGCILEAIVLAFEDRVESFSAGKGNITEKNMEDIFEMASRHNITLAPFYNQSGLF